MIKTPIKLQDLRRRIYFKAKAEKGKKFWGLYVHVYKLETLDEAYKQAYKNNGCAGIDGVKFEDIEKEGREEFLKAIQTELKEKTYVPKRYKKV